MKAAVATSKIQVMDKNLNNEYHNVFIHLNTDLNTLDKQSKYLEKTLKDLKKANKNKLCYTAIINFE